MKKSLAQDLYRINYELKIRQIEIMNVNVLQGRNPYAVNNTVNNVNKIKALNTVNTTNTQKTKEISISNSEMKLFQKLFPDNAKQIEKYIAFNRSGKVVETSMNNKGSVIDGII